MFGTTFVDNITEVGGHKPLSLLCARSRVPCICQKPLAAAYEDAAVIVTAFRRARTRLFVHENWRWQTPMRQLQKLLSSTTIGTPLRARLTMVSGFDLYANQPALRQLDSFILTDSSACTCWTSPVCCSARLDCSLSPPDGPSAGAARAWREPCDGLDVDGAGRDSRGRRTGLHTNTLGAVGARIFRKRWHSSKARRVRSS